MNSVAQVRVESAKVEVIRHRLQHPLVLSGGVVRELPEITVHVVVGDGQSSAAGAGAANLSDAWAWPDPGLASSVKQTSMIDYAHRLADSIATRVASPAHPLELGLRLHESVLADVDHQSPALARAVCASAFDAAIHDACGHLTARSAFSFFDEPADIPSADHLFPQGAVAAIRGVLQPARPHLPGWCLIAPGDDLERTGQVVARTGMSQFKIKLAGSDPDADARRVAAVHDAAKTWSDRPRLSVDTNEGSESPEAVAQFLDTLAAIRPEAFDAVAYLEQPTPRGSLGTAQWSEVSRRIPVLIDEALTSTEDLTTAARMGWSGLAIKTCKGQSFALVAAAWAAQHDLLISVQDLTNIGRSAIHSYLLAAHLPTINGIELNSPQYMPHANDSWMPRLEALFAPVNGCHGLDTATVIGLGSDL